MLMLVLRPSAICNLLWLNGVSYGLIKKLSEEANRKWQSWPWRL